MVRECYFYLNKAMIKKKKNLNTKIAALNHFLLINYVSISLSSYLPRWRNQGKCSKRLVSRKPQSSNSGD